MLFRSIHRSFIPTPNKPSSTSFPSLAICTNAARSCSHILDAQLKRGLGHLPYLQVCRNLSPSTFVLTRPQLPAFTAAIVLLLNIWGGIESGVARDPEQGMVDVGRCMNALKACEDRQVLSPSCFLLRRVNLADCRWNIGGRLR